MQLKKFPGDSQHRVRWDAYRAYHLVHWSGGIVEFDTGEVVFLRGVSSDSGARQSWGDLRIKIVGTDTNLKLATPDGVTVRKAWFPTMTNLLVDRDHKIVVGLSGTTELPIPERFRSIAQAYYYGATTPPIGQPITLKPPHATTPEEKAHCNSLRDQCRMWAELQGATQDYLSVSCTDAAGNKHQVYIEKGNPYTRAATIAGKTMADMTTSERLWMAYEGWTNGRDTLTVPYLKLID